MTTPRLARRPRAPRAPPSTTAPSTQPPDTDPATSPASFTAMVAPGSRGAEPSSADDAGDRDPVPAGPPALDVVEDFLHAAVHARLSATLADTTRARCSSDAREWPSTNSSTYGSAAAIPRASGAKSGDALSGFTHTTRYATRCEARHLLGEHLGVAAVPAVGEDHDDRAAGHAAHAPLVVELRGAPSPRRVPPDQSTTRWAAAAMAASGSRDDELAGDAGEPGAERERLDPAAADDRGVQEAHQRRGRTAPSTRSRRRAARCGAAASAGSTNARLIGSPPARSARRTVRRRSGRPRPRRLGAHAAGAAQRAGQPEIGHQPARLGELGRACSARSRAGAAPRRGCSAPTSVGASLGSASSSAARVVVAVASNASDHLALGRRDADSVDVHLLPPGARTRGRRASTSSGRRTSVARPAQYTASRRVDARPRRAPRRTPPWCRPARRARRRAAAARSRRRCGRAAAGLRHCAPVAASHELVDPGGPRALLVLAVLEDRAERDVDRVLVDGGARRARRARCAQSIVSATPGGL